MTWVGLDTSYAPTSSIIIFVNTPSSMIIAQRGTLAKNGAHMNRQAERPRELGMRVGNHVDLAVRTVDVALPSSHVRHSPTGRRCGRHRRRAGPALATNSGRCLPSR